MQPNEEQFLIAEYNQCWLLINAIDERRGKFLQSTITVVVAAVGAVGFLLLTDSPTLPLSRAIEATGLIVLTLFGSLAVLSILRAEREANIRYRKKANLIRSTLLGASPDPLLKDYLSKHKELGLLVPGDPEEPKGLGSTLTSIFLFLRLQLFGLVAMLAYVWAKHYGHIPV